SRLAFGTKTGQVQLRDVSTLKEIFPPLQHQRKYVSDVQFSPDGKRLVSRAIPSNQGTDVFLGEVQFWDLTTGKTILPKPLTFNSGAMGLSGYVHFYISPDSRWVALTGGPLGVKGINTQVHIYELATGRKVAELPAAAKGFADAMAF